MPPLTQLVEAFRSGLHLPPDSDVPALEYRTIPQWDSVGHMQLVAAVEEAFDIMLDTDEVLDMSSFKKTVEILARHDIVFDAA